MTTAVDPDNTPIEGTVFTPRQVRLLKIAVVTMGLMLLAGLGAVIVGMIYQASKVGKTPVSAASPAALESGIADAGADGSGREQGLVDGARRQPARGPSHDARRRRDRHRGSDHGQGPLADHIANRDVARAIGLDREPGGNYSFSLALAPFV